MAPRLKLFVLGPPRLERDGRLVDLPLRRAAALLVYLARTNRPQTRDALAGLLWPDADEREGRGRLRRTLHRVVEAVGSAVLAVEGTTLRLLPDADLWLDCRAFEEYASAGLATGPGGARSDEEQVDLLNRAADLYADDFLAGFVLPDSAAWDDGQFLQREELRQTCGRVLRRLVSACRGRQAWGAATEHARRWLALDPLHEPAHRALMRAYAEAGQEAAALRQYRECARLLQAEVGVEPEEATTTLYETIRARRLTPRAPARADDAAPPIQPPAAAPPLDASQAPAVAAPGPAVEHAAAPGVDAREAGSVLSVRDERRWVTVLSADLAGIAILAYRLDPEDLKALAHRWAARLSAEVDRFGGTIITSMGDGLLAVFGAPLAHEDDAERAVRAGLAIRDCQLIEPSDPFDNPIEVRIGINTGEVIAGLAGPEGRRDYTVMGGTVNVAARLMSGASNRTVLVGEETYRATRGRVRYDSAPPIETRGPERPVIAWEALDVSPGPPGRPLGTLPMVGREQELTLLEGIWTKVSREARPHLVTLLGEPGIGKSRLSAELERRLRDLGTMVLHGRCLPYGEAVGYCAMAMALREAAGITAEDDQETARLKLSECVVSVFGSAESEDDPPEIARHLALLSGLDTPVDWSGVGPDERLLHASVRRFLEALARRQPLCLVLEDIHWGDEAMLRLIELVAARAQGAPLLIVTQARPELQEKRPAWGGGLRAFTSLPLEPLGDEAGAELARALCRERDLPQSVAEQVQRQAGGHPLFAEELIAMIAERPEETGVPSAIKALISARLDRLPSDERLVVQHASVIGRQFWLGSLLALGEQPPEAGQAVAETLEALGQRDLIRRQPASQFRGDREYAFKHDLIREVAYEMLPRAQRRRLHGLAVAWIERVAGERVDEHLDLLAHHAVQAEQQDRALEYLTRAAERARRAAARREEAALLARAIESAERGGQPASITELRARRGKAFASVAMWPDARRELEAALAGLGPERAEPRAEILVDLALVCHWLLDTPALRRHASEAHELAEVLGRTNLATDASFWLAAAAGCDGDLQPALGQYQRALPRARAVRATLAPSVLPLYSTALCWAGQFGEAVDLGSEALRIARDANDTDAAILALQVQGLALAGTGRYDAASQVFEEARRFGREHRIGPFLARSIALSAGFHLDLFDFAGHAALVEEACEVARSANFPPALVSASIDLLFNLARRGEVGHAEHLVRDVADMAEGAQAWHGWLWALRLAQARAEIAMARGDAEGALRWTAEAFERSHGRRPKYQVLALMTQAQAFATLGRTEAVQVALREAVRLARSLGDRAIFVRSAAVLLAQDGRGHAGSDALLAEARSTAARIVASLPTADMRERFEAAESTRRLGRRT
jgi:class 3 adenylate cyclase/DNA-binding SARP family transcriptional activator